MVSVGVAIEVISATRALETCIGCVTWAVSYPLHPACLFVLHTALLKSESIVRDHVTMGRPFSK